MKKIKDFGFDYVDAVYAANMRELFNKKSNIHHVEWTVEHALEFLELQNDREKPFFLMFSTTVSHGPGPGWVREGKYKFCLDADPVYTPEGYFNKSYPFMPDRESFKPEKIAKPFMDDYESPMAWWDSGVGAILDKLDEQGLADNTIVIYTADHGLRNKGKTTLYESGSRVPLLVRWPKVINSGRTYSHLHGHVDFAPTLLDLANTEIPAEMKMDGISFKDVLTGDAPRARKELLMEMGYARAIRTDDYKYIAVRYPPEIEDAIANGETFAGAQQGPKRLKQPYLMKHKQLAYRASTGNPNYFSKNQLYKVSEDPDERNNLFMQMPEKAELKMQNFIALL